MRIDSCPLCCSRDIIFCRAILAAFWIARSNAGLDLTSGMP
jgi:hypothetical protein